MLTNFMINFNGINMNNEKIDRLKRIISDSNNIVFFGGAGVSTESGIRDFRGKNGLNKDNFPKSVEYYLSTRCFYYEPEEFFNFYKKNMNSLNARPNIAHVFLTKLEKNGKLKCIITQNIDGLHGKAGSKNVLELHGSIYRNYCVKCCKEYSAEYVFKSNGIPMCTCGGIIKPDVVLYGEMLNDNYVKAEYYVRNAEVLIVAGTSLTVEPAASLIKNYSGKYLIIINKDKTQYDNLANLVMNESLGNVIKNLNSLNL